MNSRTVNRFEDIDHATSRSICYAIGERLRQNLSPDTSALSSRLQSLMDEMRRRDGQNSPRD